MPVVAMPDGTRVSFPDGMTPDVIRGMIAEKFPDAVRGGRPADFEERFAAVGPYDPNPEARDQGLSRRQQMGAVEKAASPITEYPEVYSRMNREARSMMSEGVEQLREASGVVDAAKGIGKTALGAAGFVASPINAAYRTVVGQPIQDTTGIPREYTEFAAQLATPGIGLASAGKAAPSVRVVEQATPSVQELKAAAKKGYESPAVKDIAIAPREVSNAVVGIRAGLDAEGFDEIIASKAHGVLKRLESAPDGAVITGQNLRSIQKTLGKAAGSVDPQERAGAMMALKAFNEFLEGLPDSAVLRGRADEFARTVKEANANYSAAKTAEGLDRQITAAELRADASNSGMNVANTIRQRMAAIHNNPRLSRGFRPDELAQVKQIAEGTPGENALRQAGNIMGGGGGFRALAAGTAGYMAGGPAGLALPAGGMVLRGLSNRMTLANAERLSETIRSRAPLASATNKFEQRAAQFQAQRNTKTAAAAAVAARNLSTNLKDAGFNISAADLLKTIQSTPAKVEQDE
jgi:hypothetical protein